MDDVSAWVWWLVAAVGLGILEIFTLSLDFLLLASGALAASAAAALGAGPVVQITVFVLVDLAALLLVRPVLRRTVLRRTPPLRSGIAELVGAEAIVVDRVDGQGGRIRLRGEIWSARCYDGHSVLEPGTTVQVLEIDGATALVA